MMNGFLVIVRCHVDDVPVGLFETLEEATAVAERLTIDEFRMLSASAGFPDDCKPVVDCVQVLRFDNGKPVHDLVAPDFSIKS